MVFRIDSDVKVQILAPTAGEFTLNFSVLDGTDTLGVAGSVKTWADIQTEVVSFDSETGVNPGEGYFRPIAATANLRLRSLTNNPDLNNRIYVGLPIRIQVRLSPLASFTNLFVGYVSGMSTSYSPGYKYPEITLQLTDSLDSILNTVLVVNYPAQTADLRIQAINASLSSFGLNQIIAAGAWASDTVKAVTGTYTVQELLAPILQRYRTYSELSYYDAVVIGGITYYDYYVLNVQPESDAIPPAPRTYKLTDQIPTSTETSYASLETSFDSTLLANQIVISDELDAVQASENNYDSQKLSGIQSLTAVWSFVNNASLAPAWAQTVVAETDTKTYKNILFNALDSSHAVKEITDYLVSTSGTRLVDLIQTKYGLNSTVSALITRLQHNITAEGWLVTLDLWRGYKFA